jgi:hypothetical protein
LTQPVLDGLDDARRQVLFQFFAQSQFRPPEITDADVARFAAENPGLFEDRRSYRHAEITIAGGSAEAREAAVAQVEAALGAGAPVPELDALLAALQGAGLSLGMATAWVPSEVLPEDRRARLDAMAEAGRRVDVAREPERVSVIGLYEALPIPADPARLRARIEQRLVAEAFAAHRDALIAELAQTVLDRPAGEAAAPAVLVPSEAVREVGMPPRGSVVWSAQPSVPRNIRLAALFAMTVFGALAAVVLWRWMLQAMTQGALARRLRPMVPVLRQRGVAIAVAVFGLLALMISFGALLPVALRTLGDTTTLVICAGGVAIAAGVGLVLRLRERRAFDAALAVRLDEHDDDDKARNLVLLDMPSGRYLVLALALAGLYAGAMALVLDAPPGLS